MYNIVGDNMLNIIFDFIKNNISWIKDILWVIFTLVATIIAVLTYKRAKSTILQPIRTETIKKQSALLEEVLDFIRTDVDYYELLELNVLSFLMDYGFVLKNQKALKENIKMKRCGQRIVTLKEQLDFVEVLEPFTKDLTEKEIHNYKKEKFDKAKDGKIEIEMVYISKNFKDYNDKLDSFIENPFLPKKFQKILLEMKNNINYNSSTALKKVLEDFLKEYFERYKKGETHFNMPGIYNTYNHILVGNRENINNLYKEIREYLFIDYEWK